MGDVRKIAVVVEDVEAARIALRWALHNIVRYGDIITLLHVYPPTRSRSKNKARLLRLNGFQLALSFQHICDTFPSTKVEIIVTEGDQEGIKIAETVRGIQASMLVVGLHDRSFLYKLAMAHDSMASNFFNCRVLAIKHPPASPLRPTVAAAAVLDSSTNLDFSQIHLSTLQNELQSTRSRNPSNKNSIPNLPRSICNFLEIKEKVRRPAGEATQMIESLSSRFFSFLIECPRHNLGHDFSLGKLLTRPTEEMYLQFCTKVSRNTNFILQFLSPLL